MKRLWVLLGLLLVPTLVIAQGFVSSSSSSSTPPTAATYMTIDYLDAGQIWTGQANVGVLDAGYVYSGAVTTPRLDVGIVDAGFVYSGYVATGILDAGPAMFSDSITSLMTDGGTVLRSTSGEQPMRITGAVTNGATAVGAIIGTTTTLSTSGAKMLSGQNPIGTEKYYYDKDGNLFFVNAQIGLGWPGGGSTPLIYYNGSNQIDFGVGDRIRANGYGNPNAGASLLLISSRTNAAGAIGVTINTPSYTTAGAQLLSVQNNSVAKFVIDKDGIAILPLSIFSSATGAHMLNLKNTSTSGYSAIGYQDTAGTERFSLGFGNSAVGVAGLVSKAFINLDDTVTFRIGRGASGAQVLDIDSTNTAAFVGAITTGAVNTYKGVTGITAFAGGGQASATALTGEVNFVTVVATANDSVKLPVAALGKRVVVYNLDAADAMNIYPQSGSAIDALGTNNPYSLLSVAGPTTNIKEFWGASSTQWYSK